MKIGILADSLAEGPIYGPSVYSHNLVKALPRAECDVTLAYTGKPPRLSYRDVRIRRLWHSAIPWIPQWARVHLFRSLTSDLDILHDPANYHMPAVRITCKTVVTVHDVGALEAPEFHRETTVRAFQTHLPVILRHADAVITTTDVQRDKILKFGDLRDEQKLADV